MAKDRLARLLGQPGSVSFRRFELIVRRAGLFADSMRHIEDAQFRPEAAGIALKTGHKLEADPTARFLALAREAAERAVGMNPFDSQLVACCALLSGHAVEMDTGEGKTLVGALAAAGHAVSGRHVHVLLVNDYLAERDASCMRPFHELIGGQHGLDRAAHDSPGETTCVSLRRRLRTSERGRI